MNCVVTRSRSGRECQLTAVKAMQAGELVVAERPLLCVPVPRERNSQGNAAYRHGSYVWDLVAMLLNDTAMLKRYEQWKLKSTEMTWDSVDESTAVRLAALHQKTPRFVRSLYFNVATNNIGQLDEQRKLIGNALYYLLSRADHSCEPNCKLMPGVPPDAEGRLVAVRKIEPGDALTWSYFEEAAFLAAGWEERNLALVDLHRFVCRCPRCKLERPSEHGPGIDLLRYFDDMLLRRHLGAQ